MVATDLTVRGFCLLSLSRPASRSASGRCLNLANTALSAGKASAGSQVFLAFSPAFVRLLHLH